MNPKFLKWLEDFTKRIEQEKRENPNSPYLVGYHLALETIYDKALEVEWNAPPDPLEDAVAMLKIKLQNLGVSDL